MTLPKMYAHALESAADFVVDHDVDPVSIYVRAVYDYSSCSFRTVRAYIQVSANDAARILDPDDALAKADGRLGKLHCDVLLTDVIVVTWVSQGVPVQEPQIVADVFGGAL